MPCKLSVHASKCIKYIFLVSIGQWSFLFSNHPPIINCWLFKFVSLVSKWLQSSSYHNTVIFQTERVKLFSQYHILLFDQYCKCQRVVSFLPSPYLTLAQISFHCQHQIWAFRWCSGRTLHHANLQVVGSNLTCICGIWSLRKLLLDHASQAWPAPRLNNSVQFSSI